MRHSLFLLFLFFNICLCGQPTFNLVYDNGQRTELSFFSQELITKPFYFVTTASFGDSLNELQILKVNDSGKVEDTLKLPANGHQWYPENIIKTEDSHFVAAGSLVEISSGVGKFFLLKMDANLDTMWFRTYVFYNTLEGTKKVKQLSDGGYIIAGFTYDYVKKDGQNLIFKVDSLGTKEWEFTHGDSAHNEEPYDVVQLADSNLLVLSRRVYPDNDNILFLKLSPNGQLIWEKEIVSPHITIGSVIIPVNDSTILVAGQGRNNNDPGKPFVQEFDTAGNPKWIKYYTTGQGTFWHGDKVNDTTYVFAGALYRSFGKWDGYVVRTDQNGVANWKRTISPYGEDHDPSNDYFYGVLSTSDGGILCTGFAGEGPISNTQDAWIMKLDSEGLCDTPTCYPWLVTVLPNPERAEVKVWPNPATDLIQLLLPEPTGFISLHNLQGVRLLEQNVHSRRFHLALSEVPAGLYLLNWTVDGKVRETRKIVIQR